VNRNISHPGLCQQAPGRWTDPSQQAATRRLCLSCPRLDRYRRETLSEKRTFGMWAGVWIDNDLAAKRHLLQPTPRLRSCAPPRPRRQTHVGPLPVNDLSPTALAMVTARASGHCEILAPACLLDQQLILTRRAQGAATPPDSPASGLAACHKCAELIEQTDPHTALRLHHRPLVGAGDAAAGADVGVDIGATAVGADNGPEPPAGSVSAPPPPPMSLGAGDAITMATVVRGGRTVIDRVIFHTDRGSPTQQRISRNCVARLGVVQSMGRVGSCLDNAALEAFFSTLEHEVLSRHHFHTRAQARAIVVPLSRTSTTSNDGTARRRCPPRPPRETLPPSRTQLK
jgi:hypothetical protein